MAHLFWSFLNTFFNRGFSTIFAVILGHLLLPETLGYYVALMLAVNYITSLGCLHTGGAIVYNLNRNDQAERGRYFVAGWLIAMGLSALVAGLAWVFQSQLADLFNVSARQLFFVFILPLIFLKTNRMYLTRVLHADLRLKTEAIINFTAAFLQVSVCFILLLSDFRLGGALAAVYCGDIVAVALMGWLSIRRFGLPFSSLMQPARAIFRFSAYNHLSRAAVFLDQNIDLLFVTYFLSKFSLASYNYAIKFSLLFLMFGNSISHVTFPKLARAFSRNDHEEASRIYRLSINFAFCLLSGGGLFIVIHADFLIQLVLPSEYLNIIPTLTILLGGLVLFGAFSSVGGIFSAYGKPHYNIYVNMPALAVNIILCFILIPRWGIEGAAIATAGSFILRALCNITLIRHKTSLDFSHTKLLLFTMLYWGILFFTWNNVVPLILCEIILISFTILTVTVLLEQPEREILKKVVKKIKTMHHEIL